MARTIILLDRFDMFDGYDILYEEEYDIISPVLKSIGIDYPYKDVCFNENLKNIYIKLFAYMTMNDYRN